MVGRDRLDRTHGFPLVLGRGTRASGTCLKKRADYSNFCIAAGPPICVLTKGSNSAILG